MNTSDKPFSSPNPELAAEQLSAMRKLGYYLYLSPSVVFLIYGLLTTDYCLLNCILLILDVSALFTISLSLLSLVWRLSTRSHSLYFLFILAGGFIWAATALIGFRLIISCVISIRDYLIYSLPHKPYCIFVNILQRTLFSSLLLVPIHSCYSYLYKKAASV